MEELGGLTYSQAKELWDTHKKLMASGMLNNARKVPTADNPGVHPIVVYNDASEFIPAYACMEITGTIKLGENTYVKVNKPSKKDGEFCFNTGRVIERYGTGHAYPWGIVKMLGSAGTILPNVRYGAKVSDWKVEKQEGGPFIVYGNDFIDGVYKGRISGSGGGGGAMLEFQFDSSYEDADVPEKCTQRSTTSDGNWKVKVISQPCGDSARDMDEDGYITVSDPGGFLRDRDYRELPDKTGFAQLLGSAEYGDSCIWVITWIDWFRWKIVIKDLIFTETGITIKRTKIKVWDDCDLDDEEIEGIDCADEY